MDKKQPQKQQPKQLRLDELIFKNLRANTKSNQRVDINLFQTPEKPKVQAALKKVKVIKPAKKTKFVYLSSNLIIPAIKLNAADI